eukprot:Seg873.15 transcript_id=Seg873.15/GoldUCD/mRNA.D3Y31 product="hypothetical protein" protein_id=Seg873.15/GoldUCD/D3Y31
MCDSIQIIKEQTSNALADIMKQVEILKEEVLLLKRNASEAAVPSGRLKLPTDLTQIIRNGYRAVEDETEWNFDQRFNSVVNTRITDHFMECVKDQVCNYPSKLARKACQRFFESQKRKFKEYQEDSDVQDRKLAQRRRTNRRHQAYKARNRHVRSSGGDDYMGKA